jgi:L-fuconolactonase
MAAALASAAALPARILDAHTHFYNPSRPQGVPWPAKDDSVLYRPVLPPEFVKMTRPLGVTGTIVIEASAWLEDNQWILDLAREHKAIAGFVGHLEPGTPQFRNHLDRFRRNPLFRGIRLGGTALERGVNESAFLADFERLPDNNLQLDAIGNAGMFPVLLRLSDRLPALRIVIDHLPFPDPATLGELAPRPKIYAKVSGMLPQLRDRQKLDAIWKAFGPDRVIYGSNWPVSDKQGTYREVFQAVSSYFAEKGTEAQEKYFWKNAVVAYALPQHARG